MVVPLEPKMLNCVVVVADPSESTTVVLITSGMEAEPTPVGTSARYSAEIEKRGKRNLGLMTVLRDSNCARTATRSVLE